MYLCTYIIYAAQNLGISFYNIIIHQYHGEQNKSQGDFLEQLCNYVLLRDISICEELIFSCILFYLL